MKRGIWFVAGGAAGAYATAKVRRAAEALTVDGIHDRLTGLFAGARVLREELRAGREEKEAELRTRIAALPQGSGARALTVGRAQRPQDHHTMPGDRAEPLEPTEEGDT